MKTVKRMAMVLVLALPPLCRAGMTQEDVTKMLLHEDPAQRQKAYDAILTARKKCVKRLTGLVKDKTMHKSNPDTVAKAISLLGKLRAVEAAPVLAEIHSFSVADTNGFAKKVHENTYPAVGALIQIGKPGVTAILKQLEKDPKNALLVKSVSTVIYNVEGAKVSIFLLNQRLAATKSKDEKVALEECRRLMRLIAKK